MAISIIKPELLTIKTEVELPEVRFLRADQMAANKSLRTKDGSSLALGVFDRFPFQPNWNAYPQNLVKDIRLEEALPSRAEILLINERMIDIWTKESLAYEIEKRITQRREALRADDERHVERKLIKEAQMRRDFFDTVYKITVMREKDHIKFRKIQLALFDYIRDARVEIADKEKHHLANLLTEAFKNHEQVWAWRLSNQYMMTDAGGLVRVKRKARSLESVINQVLWRLKHRATEGHIKWRDDNQYTTLPSGGIAKMHGVKGMTPEAATAKIHLPLLDERMERDLKWHHSNSKITLPNGGAINAENQGFMPEKTSAVLHEPLLKERHDNALDWRQSNALISLPNGALIHMQNQGAMPERKKSEQHVPILEERRKLALNWHLTNHYGPTPNGGLAPLKNTGESLEAASGERSASIKNEITNGFEMRHASDLWGATPNGGIARLKGHGDELEQISAKAEDKPKAQVLEGFEKWHESHKYKLLPNGGFAPLPNTGQSVESVTGNIAKRDKTKDTETFKTWHAENQYGPTPNHGYAPLKNTGKSLVDIAADFDERIKRNVTEGFRDRSRSNLYMETANQSVARLPGVGKPHGEIINDVAKPTSGTEGDLTIPADDGTPLASAKTQNEVPKNRRKMNQIRSFQVSLAAHEETVSSLKGHVLSPNSNHTATNPDTLPLIKSALKKVSILLFLIVTEYSESSYANPSNLKIDFKLFFNQIFALEIIKENQHNSQTANQVIREHTGYTNKSFNETIRYISASTTSGEAYKKRQDVYDDKSSYSTISNLNFNKTVPSLYYNRPQIKQYLDEIQRYSSRSIPREENFFTSPEGKNVLSHLASDTETTPVLVLVPGYAAHAIKFEIFPEILTDMNRYQGRPDSRPIIGEDSILDTRYQSHQDFYQQSSTREFDILHPAGWELGNTVGLNKETADLMANWLKTLPKSYANRKIILLGYSKGAPVILEMLERHPELKQKVIGLITFAGVVQGTHIARTAKDVITGVIGNRTVGELIQALKRKGGRESLRKLAPFLSNFDLNFLALPQIEEILALYGVKDTNLTEDLKRVLEGREVAEILDGAHDLSPATRTAWNLKHLNNNLVDPGTFMFNISAVTDVASFASRNVTPVQSSRSHSLLAPRLIGNQRIYWPIFSLDAWFLTLSSLEGFKMAPAGLYDTQVDLQHTKSPWLDQSPLTESLQAKEIAQLWDDPIIRGLLQKSGINSLESLKKTPRNQLIAPALRSNLDSIDLGEFKGHHWSLFLQAFRPPNTVSEEFATWNFPRKAFMRALLQTIALYQLAEGDSL